MLQVLVLFDHSQIIATGFRHNETALGDVIQVARLVNGKLDSILRRGIEVFFRCIKRQVRLKDSDR